MTTVFAWGRVKEAGSLRWPRKIVKVASYDCASYPMLRELAKYFDEFIISTGAVADYAVRRFTQHCVETEKLLAALTPGSGTSLEEGQTLAASLDRRDHLFPDILPAVAAALNGSRSLALG